MFHMFIPSIQVMKNQKIHPQAKVRQSSTYLTRPLAPSAMESTVLPRICMYISEPSNPAPKLKNEQVGRNTKERTCQRNIPMVYSIPCQG